ncbi:uncharacterized protein LOC127009242 [Eriocheir sinensis]|uniref:uncharacterized protein LOC127009242 n=1 Tax=Eriocheir sinensis TaxID=95602 RepID=UPI0021C7DBC9|nr:uncharacterized protein LOC127009242 [Eriocheir sinensis]XP_050738073.1 uncharacterized protein LOC127009242 [Eriocheir sinensis]
MRLPSRPPLTLFYTWAAVLTLLVVHLWRDPQPPAAPPRATRTCLTCFRNLLRHPVKWNDKRLLKHLRNSLEPPSSFLPLGSGPSPAQPPWAGEVSYNSTEKIIRKLFGEMPGGGVFVEVGAQDGLWLSNTWWLEAERGWRGLLIEADPQNYLNLRMAPRNSTTLAACVTASLLTKQEEMVRGINTGNVNKEARRLQQGHTQLKTFATGIDLYAGETFTTTCYSIFSVLAAAGLREIDLLTFDVTGGGFTLVDEFLTTNKLLGDKFRVENILYQDNDLAQLFSLESVKDDFKKYGYSILQLSPGHYLLNGGSTEVVVAYN